LTPHLESHSISPNSKQHCRGLYRQYTVDSRDNR
jgi:hypothetical protein